MPRVKKTIKIVDIENTVENIEQNDPIPEVIEVIPEVIESIPEQLSTIPETPEVIIEQSPTIPPELNVLTELPEIKSKGSTKIKCEDCGKMILAKTLKYSHLYTCRSKKKDNVGVLPPLPQVSVQEPSVVQQPVLQEPPVVQEPVSVAYPPPQFIRRVSNLDRNRTKHVDKINKLALNIA